MQPVGDMLQLKRAADTCPKLELTSVMIPSTLTFPESRSLTFLMETKGLWEETRLAFSSTSFGMSKAHNSATIVCDVTLKRSLSLINFLNK